MSGLRLLGQLDPCLAWDGKRLLSEENLTPGGAVPSTLRGAVASVHQGSDRSWRIVRDPVGIGKLFWAQDDDGGLVLSARLWPLTEAGHALEDIRAVPAGRVFDIDPSRVAELPLLPGGWPRPSDDWDLMASGRAIRAKLDAYLAAVAAAHPAARVYTCLSGGLDSTGITALVRGHFPSAVAVSFDLDRGSQRSEDRRTAQRIARELGISLIEATVAEDALLAHLDAVLCEGIDWRDFNVHAGLVNAVLAAAIAEAAGGDDGPVLVFTGDLANEYLVDYQAEHRGGRAYYELPRLSPTALRSALVRGLEACHREVGVFGARGLAVVQPYAVAVDDYMSIPEEFLRLEDRKERLCRAIFGELVPPYVYTRPKARAQTGGEGSGGVLAACVDSGVDADHLRRRFCQLHGVGDPATLDGFLRAGRYRAATPSFSGSAA